MAVRWQKFTGAYIKFIEGKGFALLVTLCVAVITGTAVWTGSSPSPSASPTPPPADERYAASLHQQSLSDAASPTPLPTQQPILWSAPLSQTNVLQAFAADTMLRSGVTGIWATHPALDLAASAGEPVAAMADGVVTACGEDPLDGIFLTLQHTGGYTTRYAGLAALAALQPGDAVRAGQTVGFVGNGVIHETDLEPHLHLQAFKDDMPVNPLSLLP